MKNFLIYLVFFACLSVQLFSITTFEKHFGEKSHTDEGVSIQATTDGGAVLGCFSVNPTTLNSDVLVIKTDSTGKKIWEKRYGDPGFNLYIKDMIINKNNEIVIAGNRVTEDYRSNVFTLVYSPNGDFIYYDIKNEVNSTSANKIIQLSDESYYIAGTEYDSNNGTQTSYLLKKNKLFLSQWIMDFQGHSSLDVICEVKNGTVLVGSFESGKINISRINETGYSEWTMIFEMSMYYGYLKDIIRTADNKYIICGGGNTLSENMQRGYILKFDEKGALNWKFSYFLDINKEYEFITGIKKQDGNFAMILRDYNDFSQSLVIIDTSGSITDVFDISNQNYQINLNDLTILKNNNYGVIGFTDKEGSMDVFFSVVNNNFNLSKNDPVLFGNSGPPEDEDGFTCIPTSDNGFMIGGQKQVLNEIVPNNLSKGMLQKIDKDGNPEWMKTYGTDDKISAIWSVIQANDNGYAMLCYDDNKINIIRIDAQGNIIWNTKFKTRINSLLGKILQAPDGGFLVASSDPTRAIVIKVNDKGDSLWMKSFGNSTCRFNDADIIADGYIFGGYIQKSSVTRDMYFVKTDFEGNVIWEKTYGTEGSDRLSSIEQTASGDFIGIGYSYGVDDFAFKSLLIKISADGDSLWSKMIGNGQDDEYWMYKAREAKNGDLLVFGNFTPGPDVNTIDRKGVIIRTDKNGNIKWEKTYGKPRSAPVIYDGFENSDGGIVACGLISIDFSIDSYLIKTDSFGNIATVVDDFEISLNSSVFPNPATDFIEVNIGEKDILSGEIRIYDVYGQNVNTTPSPASRQGIRIDVSGLAPGMYFVRFGDIVEKFVKL